MYLFFKKNKYKITFGNVSLDVGVRINSLSIEYIQIKKNKTQ